MLRLALGWFVILHGVAHAFGMVSSAPHGSLWVDTLLWGGASVAYIAAGLGLLRAPLLRDRWKALIVAATGLSLLMIIWDLPAFGMIGVAIDVALLLAVVDVLQPRIDADISAVNTLGAGAYRHPRWVRASWVLGGVGLAYAAAALALRPVALRWGSTAAERAAALPGDGVHPSNATYRIDHGITINAPVSAVWPWLVQLGQDRGGFYSYDWLERSIGDRVHNADRIHAEWQARAVGDTILATQRDYLGGRFGTVGWRVSVLEPERVIGLENWGTFVLQPVDSTTTRLIVRTRGAGKPSLAAFLLAPVDVFVFEPAHFIMERAMLRGIRDRAEGRAGRVSGIPPQKNHLPTT